MLSRETESRAGSEEERIRSTAVQAMRRTYEYGQQLRAFVTPFDDGGETKERKPGRRERMGSEAAKLPVWDPKSKICINLIL
ncbi:hypothetical protein SLE2022_273570 [Rubroshorea leprosula]